MKESHGVDCVELEELGGAGGCSAGLSRTCPIPFLILMMAFVAESRQIHAYKRRSSQRHAKHPMRRRYANSGTLIPSSSPQIILIVGMLISLRVINAKRLVRRLFHFDKPFMPDLNRRRVLNRLHLCRVLHH